MFTSAELLDMIETLTELHKKTEIEANEISVVAASLRRSGSGGHVGASYGPDASVLPGSENRA
jgi:hypothetical protein